jgi:hypothetical protein
MAAHGSALEKLEVNELEKGHDFCLAADTKTPTCRVGVFV